MGDPWHDEPAACGCGTAKDRVLARLAFSWKGRVGPPPVADDSWMSAQAAGVVSARAVQKSDLSRLRLVV